MTSTTHSYRPGKCLTDNRAALDYTTLSLFTGAGGTTLGFENAGFDTNAMVEMDRWAAETLRRNLPDVTLLESDMRKVDYGPFKGTDVIEAGWPCFAAGTLIWCIDRPKPIEEVQVGDLVLTHTGQWRAVTATMVKEAKATRVVRGQGFVDLVTTDEHPFFARTRTSKWQSKPTRGQVRVFSEPEWLDAVDLETSASYVAQVLPVEDHSDPHSEDFWWLVGKYLADGWCEHHPRNESGREHDSVYRVIIAAGEREVDEIQERIERVYNTSSVDADTARKFRICNKELWEFLQQFGKYAHGKFLPGWVLSLPTAKAEALLEGYLQGDGYMTPAGEAATTTSRPLALGILALAQRARGVVGQLKRQEVTPTKIIEGREVNQRPWYRVGISRTNREAFVEGQYGWRPVRSNEAAGPGRVYNIAVEVDESYVAEGVVVHNCQPVSMAGERQGFHDPRGAIFFELARAIDEVQPKIVMGENVRGLISHDGGRTLETTLATFDDLGYDVAWDVLKCQHLLVPQRRERFILIATRRDLGLTPTLPQDHFDEISLREALRDVPTSVGLPYSEAKYKVMEQVPEGGNWRSLPPKVAQAYMGKAWHNGGGRTAYARRLAWDQPSLTLTTSPSQKSTERCHPHETRPLTVREYARVQTFPDWWEFAGSTSEQYKQIGNAFPPNAAFFVARHVASLLDQTT